GTETGGKAVNMTATTSADGKYTFDGLNAGTYALDEQQPNGFLDGHDQAGTPFGGTAAPAIGQDNISNIVIPERATPVAGPGYNCGEYDGSISGKVYLDTNHNGVLDADRETLITVPTTITLTGTDDTGAQVTRTAVTSVGEYKFDLVRPGTYTL